MFYCLPELTKLPGPFEKHWLDNLGNLGSNKDIQPEFTVKKNITGYNYIHSHPISIQAQHGVAQQHQAIDTMQPGSDTQRTQHVWDNMHHDQRQIQPEFTKC